MPRINEVQQHRAQVLLKRIEEYRVARIGLVQQPEELDVQREFNTLQNSLAPIGWLPEEILSMVFEAVTHHEHTKVLRFAVLVSHVTHSWRNTALATPRLWATIRPYKPRVLELEPYPEAEIERTAAFLARSGSSPMDLYINGFVKEDLQFLELIRNHYGRCHYLSIADAYDGFSLSEALACLSHQPSPFLESFQLILGGGSADFLEFKEPLFPSGAPHLKTARIDGIDLRTFHFCVGGLQSITSLSLIYNMGWHDYGGGDGFAILRDGLMALPSLIHLELQQWNSEWSSVKNNPSRRPAVLPTLQSLRGSSDYLAVLSMFRAASLTVLILDDTSSMINAPEFHFPSVQHLVLRVTGIQLGLIIPSHGQFPSVERLTLQMVTDQFCVDDILAALGPDTREAGNNGHHIPFPLLRTLALSPSYNRPLDVAKLTAKISMLQGDGFPIGKLMLPEDLLTQAGADLEAFAELRKLVEIADFRVDWPTPFASERFFWSVKQADHCSMLGGAERVE